MREDMAEYLNAMTMGDLDTLEEIISHQYRKFVRFYKIVKRYSSSIAKLKYDFRGSSSLDVVLILEKGVEPKTIKSGLQNAIDVSKYEGSLKIAKNCIHVSLTLEES